jgi:hypothetical protein
MRNWIYINTIIIIIIILKLYECKLLFVFCLYVFRFFSLLVLT